MRYVVAVGSNIRPADHLVRALHELESRLAVVALSAVYETEPVGAPGSPEFWNAAVVVESNHDPANLKSQVLRPVEAALGRVRGDDRNAPRTIDLDIVLSTYDGPPVEGVELPDPDLLVYPHLAVPVAEVVMDWPEKSWASELSEAASGWTDTLVAVEVPGWRLSEPG